MIIFWGIWDNLAHVPYEGHQSSDAQAERIPGSWLGKGNYTLFGEPAESQDAPFWTPSRCGRGSSHGSFVVFAATGVLILRSALSRYKVAAWRSSASLMHAFLITSWNAVHTAPAHEEQSPCLASALPCLMLAMLKFAAMQSEG